MIMTVYSLPVASISATTPVCPGDAISFSGGATGGLGPYSYTWSGPSGFTSFVQNPEISSAVEGNQGTYSLSVTDAHGCTSLAATFAVVVDDPAVITGDPTDVTVCQGLDAGFAVAASGTTPFTYQWQRNTGSSWTDIAGAISASSTQTSVPPSIEG